MLIISKIDNINDHPQKKSQESSTLKNPRESSRNLKNPRESLRKMTAAQYQGILIILYFLYVFPC